MHMRTYRERAGAGERECSDITCGVLHICICVVFVIDPSDVEMNELQNVKELLECVHEIPLRGCQFFPAH